MSMFSPSSWLSGTRSRLQSSGTSDFSKDESYLEGLNYIPSTNGNSSNNGNGSIHTAVPSVSTAATSRKTHNRNPSDTFEEDEWLKGEYVHGLSPDGSPTRRQAPGADLLDGAEAANHYDTFKADIALDGLNIKAEEETNIDVLSRSLDDDEYDSPHEAHEHEQFEESRPMKLNVEIPAPVPEEPINQMPSFSNASCISSLSGDDTNYDHDDKTVKSLDAASQILRPKHQVRRKRSNRGSRGQDFAGAFDHLDHLIHQRDLLADDSSSHNRDPYSSSGTLGHQLAQPYELGYDGHHQRSITLVNLGPASNQRLQRPQPLHLRSQSDTHAFRPRTPRGVSIGTVHDRHQKHKPVAAHATLRECIVKSKESGHNRLLSLSSKPSGLSSRSSSENPIFPTRSTSVTVQSSAAASTTSSGGSGVVWTGQPIDNLIGRTPSPSRKSMYPRSSSIAAGVELDGDSFRAKTHRSIESGTSYLSQTLSQSEQSSNAPGSSLGYGSGSASASASASALSISASASVSASIYRPSSSRSHRSHVSFQSRPGSASSNISVDHSISKLDDRTTVSCSTGIDSTTAAASKSLGPSIPRSERTTDCRRKNPIKEELKFVLKKLVPSPLKKVTGRRNKVNLERSSGCLT